MSDLLLPSHKRFLDVFFSKTGGFFLTGGTALSVFYLQHRRSDDLDLFTLSGDRFSEVRGILQAVIHETGGTWEADRTAPHFHRGVWRPVGDPAGVKIDMVWETAVQAVEKKKMFGPYAVDGPEDICANKFCTLLSRSELRDAIDLFFLDRSGLRILDHFPAAQKKDAGLTREILCQICSDIRLDSWPPYMIQKPDLQNFNRFFADLTDLLARETFPR
ncbi:MAG: hypothetical protein A3G34_13110 [Candidatus Lindowbacteria bacterium RIFCSPLOWO2_12_FULL_62_27]|nr:MAG: hypothetical protein A3I06_14940 [Candidatus Lindowbacteria bacterium RIFCSPLOWO2_02_FULL_62_12]OGH62524.1 MAG: hypothetical protein A3G34_13110 [Candidatus Lindowbacteria bacterium RIFCSPLOWO2_12_FULL_62_27]